MVLRISKKKIIDDLILLLLTAVLFSSACFWREGYTVYYMLTSLFVGLFTFYCHIRRRGNIRLIINNKFNVWIIIVYLSIEFYGNIFLRAGRFNWDFYIFNALLLICVNTLMSCIDNAEDTVDIYCKSCLFAAILILFYMNAQGYFDLTNIALLSRSIELMSGNINTMACCLGIISLPLLYRFYENKSLIYFAVWSFCSFGILLSGSKNGLLAILVGIWMLFKLIKVKTKYIVIPIISICALFLVFRLPIFFNSIGYRLIDMLATFGLTSSVTNAKSTLYRINFIRMGLASFTKHPIFGGGMNFFAYDNKVAAYAHNNYIELLVDMGIYGLILYYYMHIRGLWNLYKSNKICSEKRDINTFLKYYIIMVMVFDIAMVSFESLCLFLFPVLLANNINNKALKELNINDYLRKGKE